jgi:F-box/WD-40 domain protein MET30
VRVHSACGRLFSASDDTTIKMWNLYTRQCIRTFEGHVGQVQAISPVLERLSTDKEDPYGVRQQTTPREYYSSSLDGTIKSWDVETGTCTRTLFGHVEGVWALSADTLRLVTGAHDRTVKVWDRNDGKCVLSLAGHSGPVNCVHVGDARIVSGGDDGQVRIWDFSA